MMHQNRTFQVSTVIDADDLATKLTEYDWVCCQGFRLDGMLYLNDSTSEDGAQEYAVVDSSTMMQVESVTFGWMDRDKARAAIVEFQNGHNWMNIGTTQNAIENAAGHECHLCA